MPLAVIIDLGGLSLRSAGCCGNFDVRTPVLDGFTAGGSSYEQHYRTHLDPEQARRLIWTPENVASLPTETRVVTNVSGVAAVADSGLPVRHSADPGVDLQQALESDDLVVAWIQSDPPAGRRTDSLDARFAVLQAALPRLSADSVSQLLTIVTSTNPAADPNLITNESAVRVPLFVCGSDAGTGRRQALTAATDLLPALGRWFEGDVFRLSPREEILIDSDQASGIRAEQMWLVADHSVLQSVQDAASAAEIEDRLDVTDERVRMFAKPDDLWNVHNRLVEDPHRAADLIRTLAQGWFDGSGSAG